MMETVGIEAQRCYAVRCPSCCRYMNVAGSSILNDELIRCWNCKAKSRAQKWVKKTGEMSCKVSK